MREVLLSPDANRQLGKLKAYHRGLLREAMVNQLEESDATQETRNRFRLRRPSIFADYGLRVQDLRVFYRVSGNQVLVALIGRKRGNELLIEGRRFVL